MIIRDLYDLAHDAAYIPLRLAQALGEGIALGWRETHASGGDGVTITRGPAWRAPVLTAEEIAEDTLYAEQLADAEAEEEVWEPNMGFIDETSPTDDEQQPAQAQPAVGESPEVAASVVTSGYPTPKLAATAAYGLQKWMDGEPCNAPVYFRSIVRDLDAVAE